MHPVLDDNLNDRFDKALVLRTLADERGTLEFAISGFRLFKNFAVLVAAGMIDHPKETAQAILTRTESDLHDAWPNWSDFQEKQARVLLQSLDVGRDFSEDLLHYLDGQAVILDFEPQTNEEAPQDNDEDCDECGSEEPIAAKTCTAPPLRMEVFRQDQLAKVEGVWNAADRARIGELSPAQERYNHFAAMSVCGVPFSEEDQVEYIELHQQMVEEAATRIAKQKQFEARRLKRMEQDNAFQEAKATVDSLLDDVIGDIADFVKAFNSAPQELKDMAQKAGGFSRVHRGLDGVFTATLKNGVVLAVGTPPADS